jgi:uncharacterized protein (TIGR03437 family)
VPRPMRLAGFALAAVGFALPVAGAENPKAAAPSYTASSIVHAATFEPGVIVPNGLATIFGFELSYVTRALSAADLRGSQLPQALPGTGVQILVNGLLAHPVYVSPGQINFLAPSILRAGTATVTVVRNGIAGNAANVRVANAQPGLFPLEPGYAVAAHADGSVITRSHPARTGEVVVLYAAGLGQTSPAVPQGEIARAAALIERAEEFRVVIDGRTVSEGILYAGVTPGYAGLYQVNLRLPEWTGPDAEIRLMQGDVVSPGGIRIPVATGPAADASAK